MKHWCAILRMKSPLATPLSAQRLFGHICWGLAWREGPDGVADFLRRMGSDTPPLVLAEPAPSRFVAMPMILQTGQVALDFQGKHQTIWARYRRRGLLPRAALFSAAGNLAEAGALAAALDAAGWPNPLMPKRQARIRSAANRLNGAPTGCNDWLAVEEWPEGRDAHVDVVIASDMAAAEIERLLKLGLENGFGRSASVGYGQIELTALDEITDWPEVAEANALVTLGSCVPGQEDPADGVWQRQVHWGKVGGAFAAGTEAAGAPAVEKRPVMMLQPGAVLRCATAREFAGRLVEGVHPQRPEVVHYGLAPTVAIKW